MTTMPEKLTKCPRSPECAAKVIFKDSDGNLLRFDSSRYEFVPHECSVNGASVLPPVVYSSEWHNTRTGRTRYQGPFRAKKSALMPPNDGSNKYRKRGAGANPEWTLKRVYRSDLDWKPVPIGD